MSVERRRCWPCGRGCWRRTAPDRGGWHRGVQVAEFVGPVLPAVSADGGDGGGCGIGLAVQVLAGIGDGECGVSAADRRGIELPRSWRVEDTGTLHVQ